jgi:hypothetical protein
MSKEDVQEIDDAHDRLVVILGGKGDDVPTVGLESLRRFHKHLAAHLPFPFEGKLCSPIGPHRDTKLPLSVIRLLDPVREYSPEEMHGLICPDDTSQASTPRRARIGNNSATDRCTST